MQVSVSGKHLDVGDALRGHVETRLTAGVGKYFDRAIESQVQFSKARHVFRSDISVHAGRGISVRAHAEADDIYVAFENAADRIEKRLRRYKRRLSDHHSHRGGPDESTATARQAVFAAESEEAPEPGHDDQGPVTIAETTLPLHDLTVSEAVMRMELEEQPVLIFRHSGTQRINVVYRRGDGNIGWLDPAEADE